MGRGLYREMWIFWPSRDDFARSAGHQAICALIGAGIGGEAESKVGEMIDDSIIKNRLCLGCGYQWNTDTDAKGFSKSEMNAVLSFMKKT